MSAAISVRQLSVTFPGRFGRPDVAALAPLDLDVARGAILGVLGPNGSGKTTLLRVLAGLLRPTSGEARILDLRPEDSGLRRRLAYQPEGPPPMAALSGRELLQWHGGQLGLHNRIADQRIDGWLSRFELQHAARRAVKTYSAGMQRRLMLAAALLGEPEVLLLDEPTSGLDPLGSELVVDALRERAAQGTAIVMASHHLQEVEELCTEAVVLLHGRCALRGALDQLLGGAEEALVVRGLPAGATPAAAAAIAALGGDLVRREPVREHLNALFRRVAGKPKAPGEGPA